MELKEFLWFGLLYFAGIAYIFTIALTGYIDSKRMKTHYAIHLDNKQIIEKQFEDLMEVQIKTIIALATQKSMILVQDPETGGYTLRALDTASKEYVRQFIEKNYEAMGGKKNKENNK